MCWLMQTLLRSAVGGRGLLNQSVLLIDSTLSHHKPQDRQPLLRAVIVSQGSTLGENSRDTAGRPGPAAPTLCSWAQS